MDYTNLNEACQKDIFPLPRIDQIVDASTGHGMLSFLDAFSGYHQIPMHPPDAKKTTFITPYGLFCYNVMPSGLKKYEGNLSEASNQNVQTIAGKDHGSLY